ncbi:MAG: SurA N-terminal domain-containing protein [Hyphomicrobiaceae bacterium]
MSRTMTSTRTIDHLRAILLVAMLGVLLAPATANAESEQAILAIVNDDPITAFDVNQRIALMVVGSDQINRRVQERMKAEFEQMKKTQNERFIKFALKLDPTLNSREVGKEEIKALQQKFIAQEKAKLEGLRGQMMAKERPKLRDKALALLVGERLKLQEAKRLDVLADDVEVGAQIAEIAKRQGVGEKEFLAGLSSQGIKAGTFKQHIRTRISWQRVLARKFRGDAAVGQLELDEALTTASVTPAGGDEETEAPTDEVQLQLQRVTLLMPGKLNQSVMAQRLDEADQLRAKAQGCSNMALIARAAENAKHRNLGNVRLSSLPAEVRPLLANAEKGMVTPPVFVSAESAGDGDSGVQFYAVCSRNTVAASDIKRNAVKSKIENSKLAALSKGLLSDLCSSAFIEYRNGARPTRQCDAD